MPSLTVEIWSDVVCPWCYIGKRRFERALAELDPSITVAVEYRPFQLDPTAPPGTTQPVKDVYAKKFGGPQRAAELIANVTEVAAAEGLGFRLDIAVRANTRLAHRLIGWTLRTRGATAQAAIKERLMHAYFVEGGNIGDPDVLSGLAVELGHDGEQLAAMLASDDGVAELAADLALAAELGITAVPTYVIDGRWSIPGAQDPQTFIAVLTKLANQPLPAS
jgi:predicted DsbA family dithiol-disulfide isomerase